MPTGIASLQSIGEDVDVQGVDEASLVEVDPF
jgi:hypothetical protein